MKIWRQYRSEYAGDGNGEVVFGEDAGQSFLPRLEVIQGNGDERETGIIWPRTICGKLKCINIHCARGRTEDDASEHI